MTEGMAQHHFNYIYFAGAKSRILRAGWVMKNKKQ